ncbi:MAG TPA: hypothetical protein VGJ66_18850 [Pyrinomonadaceae bacterium]|jgi:hypothetical protein
MKQLLLLATVLPHLSLGQPVQLRKEPFYTPGKYLLVIDAHFSFNNSAFG